MTHLQSKESPGLSEAGTGKGERRISETLDTGVSNLLVSLGHTGRRRVALGYILNTQTLTKIDEQKKRF